MPSDPETGEVFDLPKAPAPTPAQAAIHGVGERKPGPQFVGVPTNFQEARRAMIDRGFIADKHRVWLQQQRANREGAHPDVLEFERIMIRRMASLGIPIFAHCVIRTYDEQKRLFDLGHSRAHPGQSPHQHGCAVDLVHSTKAWNLTDREWLLIGHVGKEVVKQAGLALVSLAWGGDWKFYDPAHWEVRDWQMVKDQYPWT